MGLTFQYFVTNIHSLEPNHRAASQAAVEAYEREVGAKITINPASFGPARYAVFNPYSDKEMERKGARAAMLAYADVIDPFDPERATNIRNWLDEIAMERAR